MSKSLLVFAAHYVPHEGGVETYLKNLLPRFVRQGISVTVITVHPTAPIEEHIEGVRVLRVRPALEFGVFCLPRISEMRELLRSISTNWSAVSTQTRFFPTSLWGAQFARKHRLRHVHTEHGGGFVRTGSKLVNFAAWAWDQVLGRHVLRSAAKVVVISPQVADFTRRLGVPESRQVFHPNGVDLAFWSSRVRPEALFDADVLNLLFVGRVVPEKGLQILLEALAQLPQDALWQLRVAGEGPSTDSCKKQAAQLGIAANVYFIGRQSKEELRELYQSSVYVNPTYASEGCQTTILEAVAAGAWVVTTRVGGSEAVEPGISGQFIEKQSVASLLESLTSLVEVRPKVGKSSRIRQYDWQVLAREIAETTIP